MKTRKLTRMERRYLPWLSEPGTDVVIYKSGKCFIRSISEGVSVQIHFNTLRRLEALGYIQWDVGSTSIKRKRGLKIPHSDYRIVWARYTMGDHWGPGKHLAALKYWLKKGEIPL